MPSAPLIPKIPPIRTDIQEPQQSSAVNRPPAQGASNGANTASNGGGPQHRTSKQWYYYWSKVGEQVVQNTQTLGNLVTYGPHAGRPDPSAMPDGALAVESDRGAIYQREIIQGAPAWRYIAGTMWGTLSPDQRPTDLGTHDAGFEFRTTDQPPRFFIWSGGAWVETTAVRYGTHAARLAVVVANVIEQMLWVETDRGNVIYQNQGGAWVYVAGVMDGTLSPDQRPTDLGAHDAGFLFLASDTLQFYWWSGSAWVLQTAAPTRANAVYHSTSNAALTLTTSFQAVPNTTLNLPAAGTYLVTGVFFYNLAAADNGVNLLGGLSPDQGIYAVLAGTSAGIAMNVTVSQTWVLTIGGATAIHLQANKGGGTGTSNVAAGQTTITAVLIN